MLYGRHRGRRRISSDLMGFTMNHDVLFDLKRGVVLLYVSLRAIISRNDEVKKEEIILF